jgi:hypothetical protein
MSTYRLKVSVYATVLLRVGLHTDQHVGVGVVSDREQMRWHLSTSFTTVRVDNGLCVDWQTTVGVDDDTEQTRVCLHRNIINRLSTTTTIILCEGWRFCDNSIHYPRTMGSLRTNLTVRLKMAVYGTECLIIFQLKIRFFQLIPLLSQSIRVKSESVKPAWSNLSAHI